LSWNRHPQRAVASQSSIHLIEWDDAENQAFSVTMRVGNEDCFVVAFGRQLKRPCNYQCDWKSDCDN